VIEPHLSLHSFGYRRRRGTHNLMAQLRRTAVGQRRWVIAQDDIRDAFPSAPIADVVSAFSRHVSDPRTLELVETLLRGHESERSIGIDQGNPLSPLALVLHLSHVLGPPQVGPDDPPRHEYADNLVWPCRGVLDSRQALNSSTTRRQ
jgi:retron-type reverse transcriptase